MRVVLVGRPADRARLRATLPDALEIVDEVATLAVASSIDGVEAYLVAPVERAPDPEPLTPRELDVVRLLAEGLANKAIAARLGISDQTVKFHVAAICGKLGVLNRTGAVRVAIERGVIAV